MDLLTKKFLQVIAGLRAYSLEGFTAMTYDNTLLTVALYHDDTTDTNNLVRLAKSLCLHLHCIGDFLLVVQKDFLAYSLIDKKAFGLIGKLVFGIEGGGYRQ